MADEANVEQGFNDNELADIMGEIEDLEKEFIGNQEKLDETKKESSLPKEDSPSDIENLENPDEKNQEVNTTELETEIVETETVEAEVVEAEITTELEVENVNSTSHLQLSKIEEKKTMAQKAADEVILEKKNIFKEENAPCYHSASQHVSATPPTPKKEKAIRSSNQNSMEFQLSGDMEIHLKFKIGEESLTLQVNPAEGLTIQLASGARFILPVK